MSGNDINATVRGAQVRAVSEAAYAVARDRKLL